MIAEWYYIGHYGQLGPLTREQIDELVEGGVILRDTWIWRAGMSDWVPAEQISDLASSFEKSNPYLAPPPSPTGPPSASRPATDPSGLISSGGGPREYQPPRPQDFNPVSTQSYYPTGVRSDKSRILGGILQILIPGVGRMYLGYTAIGVLQLLTTLCGVGAIWSWIDGIIILVGGVRIDGFGRRLND